MYIDYLPATFTSSLCLVQCNKQKSLLGIESPTRTHPTSLPGHSILFIIIKLCFISNILGLICLR